MVIRRRLSPSLGLSLTLGLGLAGCNFSAFDDLADEAWVDRVESPDITDSRQYGEAIVATRTRGAGTNLVVIGKSRASLSQLQYDDEGGRLPVTAIDPRQSLSFATFPDNPALAVDEADDRIAFGVVQGEDNDPTRIAIYDGRNLPETNRSKSVNLPGQVMVNNELKANLKPDGITFATLPGFGVDTVKELVFTRGPQLVVIQDVAESEGGAASTFAIKGCLLDDDDRWGFGVVVADILAAHPGPEVIFGSGEVLRNGSSQITVLDPAQITTLYTASGSCVGAAPALETITSSEGPGDLGAVIVTAQFPDVADGDPAAGLADLIYSAPSLNKVFVRFGGGMAFEIVPGEVGSDFGDSIAVGDLDGDGVPEIVIGAPKSDPDGVTNGGAAYVYKFREAPLGFDLVAALHPAQPENEERFGKSVAIAPFGAGDRNILMVGAEGEVFTYFRTNLYEDVRAGRAP